MNITRRIIFITLCLFAIFLFTGCPKNRPPKVVVVFTPDSAYQWSAPEVRFYTTDPNKDDIYYIIDWGDGSPIETTEETYPGTGETAYIRHQYTEAGTFSIKARAKDVKNNEQKEWSKAATIRIIPNGKPTKPTIRPVIENLSGVAKGESAYFYGQGSTDPENDSIRYLFVWKKRKVSTGSWQASGSSDILGYNFPDTGTYNIKAVAEDKKGALSDTSDPYPLNCLEEGYVIGSFATKETVACYSPAILISGSDSVLVFGSDETEYPSLYQVSLSTMRKKRDATTLYEASFTGTPAIDAQGNIFIADDDCRLYSFGPTLSRNWVVPKSEDSSWDISTAPVIVGDYVAFGTNDTFYILNKSDGMVHAKVGVRVRAASSPVANASNEIIFGDEIGYLWKIDINGNRIWRFYVGEPRAIGTAILSGNLIYAGNDGGKLFAIRDLGTSVEKVWEYDAGAPISSSPVIGTDNYIYFGDENGRIHSVNQNGQSKSGFPIRLTDKRGGALTITATPAFAADGIFYINIYDEGLLFAIQTDGKIRWVTEIPELGKLKVKAAYEDVEPSVIIGPDGTIYCPLGDQVCAIKGRLTGTPANTAWPRWRHDNRNTGNVSTAPGR